MPGVSTITSPTPAPDGVNKVYPLEALNRTSTNGKNRWEAEKVKTDYKINPVDQTIEFTRKPRAGRKVSPYYIRL